MAGMLPGVKCARRRRLRCASDPSSITVSGFGSARIRLSHDTHLMPSSFSHIRMGNQSDEDDKLGCAAREAKERLDGRLRGHLKHKIGRQNSQDRLSSVGIRSVNKTPMVTGNLQTEVFGLKKSGLKTLGWGRMGLSWKSSIQDECAICLDRYKSSEKITHLSCTHRFHSDCLFPWLESNAHCPCCRANVFGSN